MAFKRIGWEGSDTDRKPSASIWGRCPVDDIRSGNVNGVLVEDYFTSQNVTVPTTEGNWGSSGIDYAMFTTSGATVTPPPAISNVAQNGIAIASANSGDTVSLRTVTTPFSLLRDVRKMFFECRIMKSTIANTTLDVFVGFMDNSTLTSAVPFSGAATLADKNLFGFWSKSTAGANAAVSYKSSGVAAADISTTDVTFVANTFTKLGFKYEYTGDQGGQYYLSFYQDGVRLPTGFQVPASTGTFPINTALGLCMSMRNAAGSSPGTLTLQWWRAAQLGTPLN